MGPPPLAALPIDAELPGLIQVLRAEGALVLQAEPGAGKTTRLPPALLEALPGEVWVLEPRRLAARLAAERVAAELGEAVGERVGYQVRYETRAGPRTRLRYMTEGVLTRRLSGGGDLGGVSAVVLDEVHERHLETDLALTLLEHRRRRVQPELRLVVMSATLESERVGAFLEAPVRSVAGRVHPVTIEHARHRDERRLEDQVYAAVDRLLDEGLAGHVLCFLPGVGEIERCERALRGLARAAELCLLPLHGRLGSEELRRALAPTAQRKVLLATNVAESSLTIDGVEAVIDSGLARVAGISPQTGLPSLELRPIARASATQRANRAGRQGPGRCLRLYTRNDHERRPAFDRPQLLRSDLAGPLLTLRAAVGAQVSELRWLDAPPAAALAQAEELLRRLGAVAAEGSLSATGRAMLRYPLAPRLARMLGEGCARGVGPEAAAAAALLSERSIRRFDARGETRVEADSDLLVLVDALEEARRLSFRPQRLRALGIDARAARGADRARRQLERLLPREARGGGPSGDARDEALLLALLAGHPDRVARRAQAGKPELALAGGGGARLAPESAVRAAEWLIVLDAADPRRPGAAARVRLASAIEPEWLLELFPEGLEERQELRWEPKAERVAATWQLRYGALVVEETAESGDPDAVAEVLRKAALAAGPGAFCDAVLLEAWLRRLRFARGLDPSLPDLDAAIEDVLGELCAGRRSFAELRAADPFACLQARLDHRQRRQLERLAPSHVRLEGGRRCEVHYETRQAPWIRSRLQDFFGMRAGPAVGGGSVPLVLHLQAPNRQSVSVTSDLAGFWERHYPAARRELGRRYPRHAWPEDPVTARAPRPGRTR